MAQKYRIFIAGHSFRHVFGTDKTKEVTEWLVAMYKGENDQHPPHSDWAVEHKVGDEWIPIPPVSRRSLIDAIGEKLPEGYNKIRASTARSARLERNRREQHRRAQ